MPAAGKRSNGRSRFPLLPTLVIACLVAVFTAGSAAARVIGIVFDDSGSMKSRIHTPAFGVQLLVSTLDGRAGDDRLLTLRLSDVEAVVGKEVPNVGITPAMVAATVRQLRGHGLVERPIASAQLQSIVDNIRQNFVNARSGTPYIAIEVMLAALTEALQKGEEGYLIVVTDGKFEPDPPAAAALRNAFEDYKKVLTAKAARLTVDFLAIGLNQSDAFFDEVDSQCVRPLLLSVFNADESAPRIETCKEPHIRGLPGYHNVKTVEELVGGLEGIFAAISGTARNLGRRFVRVDGPQVIVDSPLSVSRMITIATGASKAALPKARGEPFPGTDRFSIDAWMEKDDAAARGILRFGTTTQYVFAPRPLPAGAHRIIFDRDVGSSVQLVFQTAARVVLDVLTPTGAAAPRDSEGRVVVAVGAPHRLVAKIVDDSRTVPLASLRGPVAFSAILETGSQRQRVALTRDGTADQAKGDFAVPYPATIVASADAAIEGFLTLSSAALPIIAVDGRVRFETVLRGVEPCHDCAPGTVLATFDSSPRAREIAEVTVTPRGSLAGRATLDRSRLPAWLTITDASGSPLADGAAIEVVPDKPIRLRIGREARSCAGVKAASEAFAIALKPVAPLSGEAQIAGSVRVATPPVRLTFVKPRGPTDEQGRLVNTAFGLARAGGDLEFVLEGACATPKPEEFAAAAKTWFVGLALAPLPDGTVIARPSISRWCTCLAWFDRGTHVVSLAFRGAGGLQAASVEAPFVVAPTWFEFLTCILILVGIIWIAGALIVTFRAERFPRGSVVEVREGNQLPRHVDLRGMNMTFLKALFWPVHRLIFGATLPHERRGVEGLRLVARRGGLVAEVDRDTTDFELRGQRLSEMLATSPKLTDLRINWREEVEIPGRPKITLRFLRSMADASTA